MHGHKCNEIKNLQHAIQLQGHSDEEVEEIETVPMLEQEHILQQLTKEDAPQKDKLMSISIAALQGQNGDETISY
jgi:hypothetical protein